MTEIIKEYSTALFMLASEKGDQKEYAGILNEIKKIFLDNPSYLSLLKGQCAAFQVQRLAWGIEKADAHRAYDDADNAAQLGLFP